MEIILFYQLFNIKGSNENILAIIFVKNKFLMIRTILLVAMSLVMISSILAPTGILLSDVKIVILDVNDSSEEDTSTSENEIYEKEIIDQRYRNHELFIFRPNTEMNSFSKDYAIKRASAIFLPPPEHS